jgi:thimet oligopeptidase
VSADVLTPESVLEVGRTRIERAKALLAAFSGPVPGDRVLELYNEIALESANARLEAQLLSLVHPVEAVRTAAEKIGQEVASLQNEIEQHAGLYAALERVHAADPLEQRVLDLVRRDMRRAGVALGQEERDEVRTLRAQLVELGQRFARNIRDDVRAIEIPPESLRGLPADFVASHPSGADGRVRVTTETTDLVPFLAYAESDSARRALMLAAHTRGVPSNLEILDQILVARQRLAALFGHRSWADHACEVLMLSSAARVRRFLAEAHEAARSAAGSETAALLQAKSALRLPNPDVLEEHEVAFLTEQVRTQRLSFDARSVRPYFAYRGVRQGLLDLAAELFGLSFEAAQVELWHLSVETFDVRIDGRLAGRVSLDMFPRAGKFKHAACFAYRPGAGDRQLPHYVLVCNYPDPADGPALMDHREVVQFFHEFGHVIHSIVRGWIPWIRVNEVTEWDFVEVPSKLLEEFLFDPGVLARFARHFETGEPIPVEMVACLREANEFGRGLHVQRQVVLSALALELHDRSAVDTTQVLWEVDGQFGPSRRDPAARPQASFGHLDFYGPSYYTYVWSTALAQDLLTAFGGDLTNTAAARRYRDVVLASGGTRSAMDIVTEFLGRPPRSDALARWLSPQTLAVGAERPG